MATALWTTSDTKILKDMLRKGKSFKDIGKAVGRSEGAVERRISRLKEARDPFFDGKPFNKYGCASTAKPAAKPTSSEQSGKERPAATEQQKHNTQKWRARKQTDTVLHKIVTQEPDVLDALREVSEAIETVFEAMKNHRLSKHQLQITLAAINLKEALERELESRSVR